MLLDLLLALAAGSLTTLNPCVLPLLPLVVAGAMAQSKWAPLAMGAGLAVSYALLGLFVALLGDSVGLGADQLRMIGGILLALLLNLEFWGQGVVRVLDRTAEPDPAVEAILLAHSASIGIERRAHQFGALAVVAPGREVLRQPGGVGPDRGALGAVVDPDDQHAHRWPARPVPGQPRGSAIAAIASRSSWPITPFLTGRSCRPGLTESERIFRAITGCSARCSGRFDGAGRHRWLPGTAGLGLGTTALYRSGQTR